MGISAEQQQKLHYLRREEFEPKLWLALMYAREATFADGERFSGEWLDEFNRTFRPEEAACIDKIVRLQGFANYFMSTLKFFKDGKNKDQPASCQLPGRSPADD